MSSGKSAPSLASACPDLLVRTYTACDPDGWTLRAGEADKRGLRSRSRPSRTGVGADLGYKNTQRS